MRMKNKAAGLLKKMMAIFTSAKSITDLKSKLRDLKTRLMIYSLLSRDKKVLFGSISHKFHDLFLPSHHHQPIDGTEQPIDQTGLEEEEESNLHQQLPLVIHNNIINAATLPPTIVKKVHTGDGRKEDEDEEQKEEISNFISNQEEEEDDHYDQKDKYPDLRHSLFEDDDDDEYEMGRPGSVIELVKKSKEAQKGGEIGEEFKLEDEIDEVADLFIKRFHHHMWIQKQNSFKRRTAHQYN